MIFDVQAKLQPGITLDACRDLDSSFLIKHRQLPVDRAQAVAEAEAEVFQELDFDAGMGRAQPVEILDAQDVADDLRVGDDHGRARRAIDHGHFSEDHAAGERGQTFSRAGVQRHKHAHPTASQEEQFAGFIPDVDDGLALLVTAPLEEVGNCGNFRRREVREQLVLSGGGGGVVAADGQRDFDDAILAPFQREVVLFHGTVQLGEALAQFHLHIPSQQRQVARMSEEDHAAEPGQFVQHFIKQPAGALVYREDFFEIQDQVSSAVRVRNDIVYDRLGAGEVQVALELVALDPPAALVQGLALFGSAEPIRTQFRSRELQANSGFPGAGPIQQMKIAVPRKRVTDANAANAVATGVQRRRKNRDAKLAGQDRDDPPAHPALGRHADGVNPFARVIIHAARTHHAQHALDVLAPDRLLAGDWIDSAVRKRRRHDAQVARGYGNRALLEVKFDRRNRVGRQNIEIAQHVADGAIAMARFAFRPENVVVEGHLASGVKAEHVQQPAQPGRTRLARDERRGGDGPGVDHGVARAAGARLQADGVKSVARRFHAHLGDHLLAAVVLERQSIDEGLRDGLNGEKLLGIAHFVDRPVGGDQANAEPIRVGLGQFGDVGGDLSVGHASELAVELLQIILDWRGTNRIGFRAQ